jgi:hypothetical protein
MSRSLHKCLLTIGVELSDFADASGITEEFSRVKKKYFQSALRNHPDKGGSAEVFRELQAAWESVRELYERGRISELGFKFYFTTDGGSAQAAARGSSTQLPSYDYFAEAQSETTPPYRVELAKSDRSSCKAGKGATKHADPLIPKGSVRFGSLNLESGDYGRWMHLSCWRVPSKIWIGLPDPDICTDPAAFDAALAAMGEISFCGLSELPAEARAVAVTHIMNKSNWARLVSKSVSDAPAPAGSAAAPAAGASASYAAPAASASASYPYQPPAAASARAIVPSYAAPHAAASSSALATIPASGGAFITPRPGVNGAPPNSLQGKTLVLTGQFPEIGGGCGLDLGKARVTAMIASFGGRVTSAVSGKTSYVVVGKSPGASKVSQGRARGVPLIDLMALKQVLEGSVKSLADTAPPVIGSFSAGYTYRNGESNGLGALVDESTGIIERHKPLMEKSQTASTTYAPPPEASQPKAPKAKKAPKAAKAKAPKPAAAPVAASAPKAKPAAAPVAAVSA